MKNLNPRFFELLSRSKKGKKEFEPNQAMNDNDNIENKQNLVFSNLYQENPSKEPPTENNKKNEAMKEYFQLELKIDI